MKNLENRRTHRKTGQDSASGRSSGKSIDDIKKIPICPGYIFPWRIEVIVKGKKELVVTRNGFDWGKMGDADKRLALGLLAATYRSFMASLFPNEDASMQF